MTTARGLAVPHNSMTLDKRANLASQSNVQCIPSKPAPLRKRRPPHQALQEKLAAVTEKMEQMRREMDAARATGNNVAPTVTPSPPPTEPTEPTAPLPTVPTTARWDSKGNPTLIQEEGGVRFMDSLLATVYQEVCHHPLRSGLQTY